MRLRAWGGELDSPLLILDVMGILEKGNLAGLLAGLLLVCMHKNVVDTSI